MQRSENAGGAGGTEAVGGAWGSLRERALAARHPQGLSACGHAQAGVTLLTSTLSPRGRPPRPAGSRSHETGQLKTPNHFSSAGRAERPAMDRSLAFFHLVWRFAAGCTPARTEHWRPAQITSRAYGQVTSPFQPQQWTLTVCSPEPASHHFFLALPFSLTTT